MSNETYLLVSYFAVGMICLCLGLAAYLWLRRPLHGIFGELSHRNWGSILKKSFPLSIILFALSSCLSVNYYDGCNPIPYGKIVEDRAYIITKNREQISQTLSSIAWGVSVWGFIVLLSLMAIRRGAAGGKRVDSSDLQAGNRPT
jgi:hypothetical protein